MKRHNYIIKATAVVLITLAAVSCQKEVLDTKPYGVLAEGVSSATTVDKLVVAAYAGLGQHFFGNAEAFAGPISNWIIDVRSGDAYKGGGGIADRSDIHQLETATYDPTNYAIRQEWRNNMYSIARTNLAIREITSLADNDYPKNIRIAEMRLLRGFFHFELKREFKHIPYLEEDSDPFTASNRQYSEAEIWKKIEDDFKFAYDNLPTSQDEKGRLNKYTAAAMLAKLYMELGEHNSVITMTDFIMLGNYGLEGEFENLTKLEAENGPEAVFTIQFSTANNFANHNWGDLLNVTQSPGMDGGGYANGDDFYLGSQDLVNAYRTDNNGLPLFDTYNDVDVVNGQYSGSLDPRVDFTVGRIGIPWKGTALYAENWIRSADYYPGFSCKKHVVAPDDPNIHNSFPWAASGLNFMIVRYAEVLLWRAEALIELNQNLEEARTLINEVRGRAKNSTYVKTLDGSSNAANYKIGLYPPDGWNQDYARKALRFERRLELALEGHRFFDLKRWGVAANVLNRYYQTESNNVSYLEGAQFVAGKHEYFPIPQNEIDLAPGIYVQNDNY